MRLQRLAPLTKLIKVSKALQLVNHTSAPKHSYMAQVFRPKLLSVLTTLQLIRLLIHDLDNG